MKNIVLITGGFDPVHSGHIAYLEAARQLGDVLVVGVNSDAWLERKKGRAFMPLKERATILRSLKGIDFVIDFDDRDGSARHAIRMTRQSYPQDHIIFANGGDRTDDNIPEMDVEDNNLEFRFGVGGETSAIQVPGSCRNGKHRRLRDPGDTIVCCTKHLVSRSKNSQWSLVLLSACSGTRSARSSGW